jgi:hypothetical protein
MRTREELEQLSTKALHDLSIDRARHHADVAFLWRLVKALPVAEEIAGDDERAKTDILRPIALINDALYDAGQGDLGEALRPLYIEYLLEHSETETVRDDDA